MKWLWGLVDLLGDRDKEREERRKEILEMMNKIGPEKTADYIMGLESQLSLLKMP